MIDMLSMVMEMIDRDMKGMEKTDVVLNVMYKDMGDMDMRVYWI